MYDFQRIENSTPVRQQIISVFHNSFSASEGESEGALIRTLVEQLLENTPEPDIFVFAALHDDTVIGCGIFSRLTYSDDVRNVFILSPMAIHPDHQNKGIGQTLLRESIAALRTHGIDILMTYGDLNYYEKLGFHRCQNRLRQHHFHLACRLAGLVNRCMALKSPRCSGPAPAFRP